MVSSKVNNGYLCVSTWSFMFTKGFWYCSSWHIMVMSIFVRNMLPRKPQKSVPPVAMIQEMGHQKCCRWFLRSIDKRPHVGFGWWLKDIPRKSVNQSTIPNIPENTQCSKPPRRVDMLDIVVPNLILGNHQQSWLWLFDNQVVMTKLFIT